MKRDSKGRFIETTGCARYKRIIRNGKNLQLHRHIWKQHNGKIPEGYIVHHINGDKKDNRIDNLKAMSQTEHNNIHAHQAWNKGIKCPNISKSKMGHVVTDEQITKVKETWKDKYINSMESIDGLFRIGLDMKDIGSLFGISYRSIHWRYKKYIEDYTDGCWDEREYGRFRKATN